jgi:hypothetical protein
MSKLFVVLSLLMGISVFRTCAQDNVVSTTKGEITFYSSAPLEDIDAKNKRVISMLNMQSLEILVRVPINQFEFQNKLMQQHFNEKYLESDRYPYATFKGKVSPGIDFSEVGTVDVSAVGVLNLHGVDQKRTLTGKITVSKDGIKLDTRFNINLADHKIDIPKLVFNKIAERIAVHATLNYIPFKN